MYGLMTSVNGAVVETETFTEADGMHKALLAKGYHPPMWPRKRAGFTTQAGDRIEYRWGQLKRNA